MLIYTASINTASIAVESVPNSSGHATRRPSGVCMYVCMYVYMDITNSRVWINRVRLPSLLVICYRSRLIIWSLETGSAVSSRVSLLVLHTQAECGAYLRCFSRFPRRRPFIYNVDRHRVSPSLSRHSIAYRQRSLPRGHRRRVSSLQGRRSSGCCLFRY